MLSVDGAARYDSVISRDLTTHRKQEKIILLLWSLRTPGNKHVQGLLPDVALCRDRARYRLLPDGTNSRSTISRSFVKYHTP